jgi:single-stranded DNA-binding protein
MNTYIIHDARLVAEPKVITLKDNKVLTKVRLADNPPGKKDDKRPARFVTAKSFGKQGEALAKLSKGDVISVSGDLAIEAYQDKEGNTKTEDVLILGKFRVQKSESFFAEGNTKPDPEDASLDDLFGGGQ